MGIQLGGVCQEVIREINRQHPTLDVLVPGESYQSAVRWMPHNKVPFLEGENIIIDCHAYPDRDASGQWKLANGGMIGCGRLPRTHYQDGQPALARVQKTRLAHGCYGNRHPDGSEAR